MSPSSCADITLTDGQGGIVRVTVMADLPEGWLSDNERRLAEFREQARL
ncbi:hypothetical protein [Kitasatospora sp. NPDC094015]